jgi:hypothetical protein
MAKHAERRARARRRKSGHWLMIYKKDWLGVVRAGEPNFEDVAHYLRSEEGTVWRQQHNVTTVATAEELLEWKVS